MSVRRTRLSATFILTVALAAAAGPLFTVVAYADPSGPTAPSPYNATINQGNVPTTAAAYTQDCNTDEFGSKPADADGWLFVASPSNFSALEAIFTEGTFVYGAGNNPSGTSAYFTKTDDHLAVITPAGWTLTQAYATLDGDKDFFTLSHTCAATSPQPQPTSSPGATKASSTCDSVTFALTAGSSDTTFTVRRTGESTTTAVPVSANQSTQQVVPLDASHPGATVSVGSTQLASFTRPDSCDEQNNNSGGDDNGSDVGSATGSTGSGGGTTTSVLGEKLTKTPGSGSHTPTAVEAAGISRLPFTGFDAGRAVELAGLLCVLGVAVTALGRRRRATR